MSNSIITYNGPGSHRSVVSGKWAENDEKAAVDNYVDFFFFFFFFYKKKKKKKKKKFVGASAEGSFLTAVSTDIDRKENT